MVVWAQRLSERVNQLPAVLAGPILRRVHPGLVSVWIACRYPFKASLFIGKAELNGVPASIRNDPGCQIGAGQGPFQSVRLGKHLHVALLKAESLPLPPDELYQYTIRFDLTIGDTTPPEILTQWLDDVGILSNSGGLGAISYGDYLGPTFLMPATSPDDVRFVHASCRKPHGGKVDAMAAIDKILADTHSDLAERPRQLFLTGDQVYVDDVDAMLLYMLMDASNTLLEWGQPEIAPGLTTPPLPGTRQNIVVTGGMATDEGASHLIYLGEFYAMYLFAWSDTLWPALADFPTLGMVRPGAVEQKSVSFWLGAPITISRDTDEFEDYNKSLLALARFRSDLPKVRKALANIATYMMFDDHEVSDDWFLSAIDTEMMLAQSNPAASLSRRIIQNALAAYTVFQAWGNTPDRFLSGPPSTPGRDILTLIAEIGDPAANFDWADLGDALLPTFNSMTLTLERPAGALDWHYSIDFGAYLLVVLDTRTHRAFDSLVSSPRLICDAHLAEQIPFAATPNYLLLLSPAPVIGYVPVEQALQLCVDLQSYSFAGVIQDAAPSLGSIVPDGLAKEIRTLAGSRTMARIDARRETNAERRKAIRLAIRNSTMNSKDFEAWGYNSDAFEKLLERISVYPRVVILSGDVHYSFSATMEYWNDRTSTNTFSVFTQLCCSAARNNAGLTDAVDGYSSKPVPFTGMTEYVRYCWDVGGPRPLVLDDKPSTSAHGAPHWQYRIQYSRDWRNDADRDLPETIPSLLNELSWLSTVQLDRMLCGRRVVVGTDNIAVASFAAKPVGYVVNQAFHWSLVGINFLNAPVASEHTVHNMLLGPATPPTKPWI